MDNLLSIELEARNPERNHFRWYRVSVGRDLFDCWTVALRYGRLGSTGQIRTYSGVDVADAQRLVRRHLRRRLSAPLRLGCSYELIAFRNSGDGDAAAWLPEDSALGAEASRLSQSPR